MVGREGFCSVSGVSFRLRPWRVRRCRAGHTHAALLRFPNPFGFRPSGNCPSQRFARQSSKAVSSGLRRSLLVQGTSPLEMLPSRCSVSATSVPSQNRDFGHRGWKHFRLKCFSRQPLVGCQRLFRARFGLNRESPPLRRALQSVCRVRQG